MKTQYKYCCINMKNNIEQNNIIYYSEIFNEYGINSLEDNISYTLIEYCPWCGRKLPDSQRELWFEELEKLGIDDPLSDEEKIPKDFKCVNW